MKCNAANRWFWITALGVMVPCLLYSGEITNQTPPAVSTEKTKEVEPAKQEPPPPPVTPVRTKIVYKPPLRGAPVVRIDGGSRGSGVSLVSLTVLAPDHTGLTVHEQPTLFWYQSLPEDVPFELTLLADNTIQPLLTVRLPNSRAAGIQRLNLAEHNVKLCPALNTSGSWRSSSIRKIGRRMLLRAAGSNAWNPPQRCNPDSRMPPRRIYRPSMRRKASGSIH